MKPFTVKDMKDFIKDLPDDFPFVAREDSRPLTFIFKDDPECIIPTVRIENNIKKYYYELDENLCKNGFILIDLET